MPAQSNPETLSDAVDRLEDLLDFHQGAWTLESRPFTQNPARRYCAVAYLPWNLLGGASANLRPTWADGDSPVEAIANLADRIVDHLTGRAA